MNYFQASPGYPAHLSVGAVIFDKDKNVYCHYWKQKNELKDLYSLMHETIEPNETIEETLHRGLKEELGMTGEIIHYLGSLTGSDEWFGEINKPTIVQKTTLYFLVNEISYQPENRVKEDWENDSEILQFPIEELITRLKDQTQRTKIAYLNEVEILEKALKFTSR